MKAVVCDNCGRALDLRKDAPWILFHKTPNGIDGWNHDDGFEFCSLKCVKAWH